MAAGPAPSNLNLFLYVRRGDSWQNLHRSRCGTAGHLERVRYGKGVSDSPTYGRLDWDDAQASYVDWQPSCPRAGRADVHRSVSSVGAHGRHRSVYCRCGSDWSHADLLVFQARQARRMPSYWTRDLLEGSGAFVGTGLGTANPQLGTDGLTLFNTAHLQGVYQTGGATYSNDFTGGGINVAGGMPGGSGNNILVGGAFSPTAFMTLAEYMMQYRGEDGEPLGAMPSTAMFPASLFGESQLVLKSMSFAPPAWGSIGSQVGAADNPLLRYGITPIINRYLTNGQKWYLFDGTKSRKPMGWGVHKQPTYAQQVAETSESVFSRHYYIFGLYGHATPFWGGFPWLMSRSGP